MVPDPCDVCLSARAAPAPGHGRSPGVPPSRARRAPLVLLPLLLAALTACAGTSPTAAPAASSSAPAPASSAPAPASSSPAPDGTAAPKVPTSPVPATAEVTRLTLELADGEVTGDTPLAQLTLGRPVRLEVTSDVADELHVHGVDETVDLVPGETAALEFTPESPGRFEVELHDARRVLTRLQVR